MSGPIRILIAAAIMTAALVYMIWDRMSLVTTGRVVTLQVVPVDPRDMFRGDYVILNYKISRLDLNTLGGDSDIEGRGAIYVTLAQANGTWDAVAVSRKMPSVGVEQAVIRGEIISAYRSSDTEKETTVGVNYGIESFFVPEGKGRPIEDERNKDNVTVDVALGADGRAAIKTLKLSGSAVHTETLF
jgi:uncharacterized membrane-anchored protein